MDIGTLVTSAIGGIGTVATTGYALYCKIDKRARANAAALRRELADSNARCEARAEKLQSQIYELVHLTIKSNTDALVSNTAEMALTRKSLAEFFERIGSGEHRTVDP